MGSRDRTSAHQHVLRQNRDSCQWGCVWDDSHGGRWSRRTGIWDGQEEVPKVFRDIPPSKLKEVRTRWTACGRGRRGCNTAHWHRPQRIPDTVSHLTTSCATFWVTREGSYQWCPKDRHRWRDAFAFATLRRHNTSVRPWAIPSDSSCRFLWRQYSPTTFLIQSAKLV